MGSRRCCSCEQVLRCEGCCSDCMVSYTLERKGILLESGSPFGIEGDAENPAGNADPFMPQVPGDEIIVHFGGSINIEGRKLTDAPVQQSYKNIGSFWTWYPPPFMVDFNPSFPSCTTLPIFDLCAPVPGQGSSSCPPDYGFFPSLPAFSAYETPGSSPQTGDKDNYCYLKNNRNLPPIPSSFNLCAESAGLIGYYSNFQDCGLPKFDTISEYDPYDGGYPEQLVSPIFGGDYPNPNSVQFKIGGSINFKQSYPCSTADEDNCCRYSGYQILEVDRWITGVGYDALHIAGQFGQILQNRPNSCNYLGLTKYRRRILKTYYPWAWQIFSYNLDKLLPFGNPTWHWASLGTPEQAQLVKVGQKIQLPNDNNLYLTSLRFQFLGFAFCEHHYDRACGCFFKADDIKDEVIFGRYIPRRFMFACSGIPMFEFDIYEAIKDGTFAESEVELPEFIRLWKSFTTWIQNPNRDLFDYLTPGQSLLDSLLSEAGVVHPNNVPSIQEIDKMRSMFDILSSRKYSGIRATDWRYEATLDIIKANDFYKEAIRKRKLLIDPEDDTEVEFDIIQAVGGFNFTIEQVRSNPKQYCREIFTKPLGPVRKRCRMNNAPVSTSIWNNNGEGNLVTLTSEHGVNVLVPRTFPLNNSIQPEYVVDSQFIDLQAIKWFDIGKPYTQAQASEASGIPRFNGDLSPPDLENFPDINWTEKELAQDLNNNLSHLMYTYFYTQPNGWDWIGYGPQLNGNKPENNWWNRKFTNTQSSTVENLWSITNPHTPLSRIGGYEYAWNPNARGWFKVQ